MDWSWKDRSSRRENFARYGGGGAGKKARSPAAADAVKPKLVQGGGELRKPGSFPGAEEQTTSFEVEAESEAENLFIHM